MAVATCGAAPPPYTLCEKCGLLGYDREFQACSYSSGAFRAVALERLNNAASDS